MKVSPISLTLIMAMAVSSTVSAQTYRDPRTDPTPPQTAQSAAAQTPQQSQYDRDQADWRARQDAYDNSRGDYEARRQAYERDRASYERQRAEFDARNGAGAYERANGAFRYDWNGDGYAAGDRDQNGRAWRQPNDARNGGNDGDWRNNREYDQRYSAYRDSPCERRRSDNTTLGGVIGALAGAAIGSNLAARNARTEGAVLGAVAGGLVGGSVGRSTAKCDGQGYYYSYSQTMPYREPRDWNGNSGRYDRSYYSRRRCRLAIAPAAWNGGYEDRYVRVCPDGRGRYRFAE